MPAFFKAGFFFRPSDMNIPALRYFRVILTKGVSRPTLLSTMTFNKKQRIVVEILLGVTILLALAVGTGTGIALAQSHNIQFTEELGTYKPALPSQVLDRNGDLITEVFADQKRQIVTVDDLPKHLLFALITREDEHFYDHIGFSIRGTLRAVWNILTGQYISGGSTITQQVAGRHYADRSDFSIQRKLRELWYAFQLERYLTKDQILEMYMNEEYFGHNTYGVEAASQFYFGRPSHEITPAESAILVIQLASPARYSPINNPNNAKEIQFTVLKQMAENGYIDPEQAEISYRQYWSSYDYTRSNTSSAYFENESRAPYFSEYVRLELEEMLYGSLDINRDGFVVHTTLDLDYQEAARRYMDTGLHRINRTYRANSDQRMEYVNKQFVPVVEMLSLAFNLPDIRVAGTKKIRAARALFYEQLRPTLEVLSLLFGSEDIKFLADMALAKEEQESKRNIVEGALLTLENETGRILAMVGGSDFTTKKLNRAVQAKVQPGSSFKPLYYSAAISSRDFTPATMIYDAPVVFWNDDGTPYKPFNYMGRWEGPVRLRYALAHSMNVPSIKVLDAVGFDAAITRASRLLGITDPAEISRTFPRRYPLALGIVSIAPIQMAKAFSTFANAGREVEPIAIVYVEDRNGNIILEPEKELRARQKKLGDDLQILTPQEAYIMVSMLESTVEYGTLANRRRNVGGFDGMPMAGKTGTTQNWSDAWTVGFSPYMTTAIWFGFDMPGNSLGVNQTGATAAGPIWAGYMKDIHADLPIMEFPRPETGLTEMEVCAVSGMLPTEFCSDGTVEEIFLTGTEPHQFCTLHKFRHEQEQEILDKLLNSVLAEDVSAEDFELPDPGLEDSVLGDFRIDSEIDSLFGSSDVENPLLD